MSIYINSNTGLELSWEAVSDQWGQHLSFEDFETDMAPLKPVTYSFDEDTFYAAAFGLDGRISGITDTLTDERNANKNNSDGYYLKATFYARTGENVKVSLMPAAESPDKKDGAGTYLIGTPIWNSNDIIHENGGLGAEYAIRVGLRITKTDLEGNARDSETPDFYIYEPNCDRHVGDSEGYIQTYNINGGAYAPDENMILQTASSWSEVSPVERNAVFYELGQFEREPHIFNLEPEDLAKIELYVWLEGQDIDCVNSIGRAAQILTNIQFNAEANRNTGLQPIE